RRSRIQRQNPLVQPRLTVSRPRLLVLERLELQRSHLANRGELAQKRLLDGGTRVASRYWARLWRALIVRLLDLLRVRQDRIATANIGDAPDLIGERLPVLTPKGGLPPTRIVHATAPGIGLEQLREALRDAQRALVRRQGCQTTLQHRLGDLLLPV